MNKFIDLTNKKFGKLKALEYKGRNKSGGVWRCLCDCGKEVFILGGNLRKGKTQSCGCYRFGLRQTHGKVNTRIYRIWKGIKQRCINVKHNFYKDYGGRGITICDEWRNDFQAFYDWAITHGYSDDLTIDRINNDGNYEPSNCRWTTNKTQQRNKRTNHLVMYKGEIHTIAEWSEIFDIPYNALYLRLVVRNWSVEKAFTTPVIK